MQVHSYTHRVFVAVPTLRDLLTFILTFFTSTTPSTTTPHVKTGNAKSIAADLKTVGEEEGFECDLKYVAHAHTEPHFGV